MFKLANIIDKIATVVVRGYRKIETGVVNGYKKIETGAVNGFEKVTDRCVAVLFAREGETVAQARVRLAEKPDPETAKSSHTFPTNREKGENYHE